MSLLIINADDFGYGKGINYGIVESYRNGILSSTTLMANMPGFEHAVELAAETPDLGIGVHLTLTCHKPLCSNVKSLTNEQGNFHHLSFYEQPFSIDLDELALEWETQIQKIITSGITPTHLDSHHHVNILEPINEVFELLATKYDLPVRNNYEISSQLKTTKRFFTQLDGLGVDKEIWKPMTIRNLIQDVKTYGSVEAMCHPGYVDSELLDRSSFTSGRAYQARELQKNDYQILLKEHEIQLGTYREL